MTSARTGLATSLLLLAGCGSGTALLLVVDPSAVPGVEQLQIMGRADDNLIFGPAIRPEQAGPTLEGEQSLRVLLDDGLAGRPIEVTVEALVHGVPRGSAAAEATPVRGQEVRVEMGLVPIPAACVGCEGCCDDGRCLTGSLAACGAGGAVCVACDPQRADRCTDEGRCGCGDGPACAELLGADRCVDNACQCGDTGGPCAPGQACENGLCRCTAASCAGCCEGNSCLPGTTNGACGNGGVACTSCTLPQQCAGSVCN